MLRKNAKRSEGDPPVECRGSPSSKVSRVSKSTRHTGYVSAESISSSSEEKDPKARRSVEAAASVAPPLLRKQKISRKTALSRQKFIRKRRRGGRNPLRNAKPVERREGFRRGLLLSIAGRFINTPTRLILRKSVSGPYLRPLPPTRRAMEIKNPINWLAEWCVR